MSSRTETAGSSAWTMLLAGTIAAAAILRIVGLGSGLWFDEIMTLVLSARLPLARIMTQFPGINAHPLYSVLAHASMSTFGDSKWALRLPSCLFGIASVWMVYVLGTRLTSRIEAWAAAAVLATSYHHIWFSQNARGYTMLGFFTLLSTDLLVRPGPRRRRDYVLYAVTCAAGVYTHLTMAFVVAGQAIVMLGAYGLRRRRTPEPVGGLLWAWTAAAVLSVMAYAPFAKSLLALMTVNAPREAAEVATASWALSEAIRSVLSGAGIMAAVVGAVLAATGGVSLWRRQPLALALFAAPAVVTGLVIAAMHQPLRPRFFFFLSGPAAILVARGIGALVEAVTARRTVLSPAPLTAGVVACTVGLMALSVKPLAQNYRLPKQDFDGAVRFLETAEREGATISAAGPICLALETYFSKTWRCLKHPDDLERVSGGGRSLVVYTLADYIQDRALASRLHDTCAIVQRFPGTLGGGEVIVCDPRRLGRP